jgi:aminocyclitol acetyltransferase
LLDELARAAINGRELVVWGTGGMASDWAPQIERCHPASFYVSNDAADRPEFLGKRVFAPCFSGGEANLSPDRHYVVIAAGPRFAEIRDGLRQAGFRLGKDYFDFFASTSHDAIQQGVPIGKCSYAGSSGHFFDMQFIRCIGRFCSINQTAVISVNHPMNMITTSSNVGRCFSSTHHDLWVQAGGDPARRVPENKVSIGNDVWIGANAFINSSRCAVIGDGAIVGTGAIVMHDVPPYAIVYGQPARVQRYRFAPEQIETLLRVRWWDWDDETLDQNAELLIFPEKFFERFG